MCEICIATASFDPQRHQTDTSTGTGGTSTPTGTLTSTGDPLPTLSNGAAASASAQPATGTLQELSTYLTDGYWESVGSRSHSFADGSNNTNRPHKITVDLTGLTADGQRLARWALDAWELVANVQFTDVQSGADITFDDADDGAYASFYTDWLGRPQAEINISTFWLAGYGTTMDSYSYSTYVHEIGHALGLGHLGPYNGSYSGNMAFANDSYQVSVMSYIRQDRNDDVEADYAEPIGPMTADILAVQNIYGASDVTAGNTTWGVGGTYSRQFETLFSTEDGVNPTGFAIYDAGGNNDTIDLRANSKGNGDLLDLNAETFSDISGLHGNLSIARGTRIENALMGRGADTVIGNDADNRISGDAGRDSLYGNDGNDTLFGGRQSDRLYGGRSEDRLVGGGGSDRLVGGSGADHLSGGGGSDRLYGGRGSDRLVGNGGSDRLFGGSMDDRLFGRNGADYLDGGAGTDRLFGGAGSDDFIYTLGHDTDIIRDFTLGEDRLVFQATDFAAQDGAALLETYGRETSRGIRLDFGGNDTLILTGIYDVDQLVDDIIFV